jgi:hypothetical protein
VGAPLGNDYYQGQYHGEFRAPFAHLPPPPRISLLRRAMDFLMMAAVGIVTIAVLLGGIGGGAHILGPDAPTPLANAGSGNLWVMTGIGGFILGLSWRFLFWDLPGMMWYLLMTHRRNLQYVCVLGAGIAILVFI